MWQVTHEAWHMTHDLWHVTSVMWSEVNILSKFQVPTYSGVKVFGRYLTQTLHTGNTRPSRTCVTQEFRYYTMSLSQYHWRCQYNKSMSITWVLTNTMSPCLYHESMSKPSVHVYSRSPCLNHKYGAMQTLTHKIVEQCRLCPTKSRSLYTLTRKITEP